MNRIKTYIFIIFLSLFVLGGPVIHAPISVVSQTDAQEEEDNLAAISFKNISEANFEQVPDSIHTIVKNHILQNNPNLEISYAQTVHGQTKGEYIIMVAKHDVDGQNQQLVYYVIAANGNIKQVTKVAHINKIQAFVPRQFYSSSKIISYVDSKQKLQIKDNSFSGIRARYNQELVAMANEIEAIGLENIIEEQARRFYQKRLELVRELKDESSFLAKMGIYARNLWKYQDTLGPTYDSFAIKGLSPTEIAVKSVTSGGGDFGLKSNANNPTILQLKKQLQNKKENKFINNRIVKQDKEQKTKIELKQSSRDKINISLAKPFSEKNNLRSSLRLNNRKIELHKEKIQYSDKNN